MKRSHQDENVTEKKSLIVFRQFCDATTEYGRIQKREPVISKLQMPILHIKVIVIKSFLFEKYCQLTILWEWLQQDIVRLIIGELYRLTRRCYFCKKIVAEASNPKMHHCLRCADTPDVICRKCIQHCYMCNYTNCIIDDLLKWQPILACQCSETPLCPKCRSEYTKTCHECGQEFVDCHYCEDERFIDNPLCLECAPF